MEAFLITVQQVLSSLPYFAVLFVLAFLAKLLFEYTTSYSINEELTTNDNPAFGVAFAGYVVGMGLALSGALFGLNPDRLLEELLTVLLYGTLAAVLMRVSILVNDRLILHSFCIEKEMVQDRNAGTGFVVAGSCIATGFMLKGVLSGYSDTLLLAFRDIAIYFLTGQLILVVGGLLFVRFSGYDVHEEIEKDNNVAAGISFGGFLVALGYITSIALTGATSQWVDEVVTALTMGLFGVILLLIARVTADRILLPNSPLAKEVAEDGNKAAGAVAAASFLLVGILFAHSVHPQNTIPDAAASPPEAAVMLEEPEAEAIAAEEPAGETAGAEQ
jgi:uncharacterized membrane protein YjfL (UPF0719 family)